LLLLARAIARNCMGAATNTYLVAPTFSLYQELAIKIRMSLQSSRKGNPEVKVVMDFDKLQFNGRMRYNWVSLGTVSLI